MLDDLTSEQDDLNLHSISHAVVRLEQLAPEYGKERRRLRVIKMRGSAFRGGYHDFVIRKGGVHVFPVSLRQIITVNSPWNRSPAEWSNSTICSAAVSIAGRAHF